MPIEWIFDWNVDWNVEWIFDWNVDWNIKWEINYTNIEIGKIIDLVENGKWEVSWDPKIWMTYIEK